MEDHVEHSRGFADALPGAMPRRCLDLGSGGGVPGLVLADLWPDSEWVLLDGQGRRVTFLQESIERLALGSRVTAVHARAEDAGRDPGFRASFDLVTARSFGAPAVVAECAAPLLRVGGRLVVSEPPDSTGERWETPELSRLGLQVERVVTPASTFAVLEQAEVCPSRFPRRPGVPERRPLF